MKIRNSINKTAYYCIPVGCLSLVFAGIFGIFLPPFIATPLIFVAIGIVVLCTLTMLLDAIIK
jgi:hypothetical protein